MKKLLLLTLLITALPLVCATNFVQYEAYEGIITPNGEVIYTTQAPAQAEATETILRSEFSGKYGITTGSYKHRTYNWYERMFLNKDNRHDFIALNDELKLSVKTKYSKEEPLQIDKITNKQILNNVHTKTYYDFIDLSAVHPEHTATVYFFAVNGNDLDYTYKKVAGRNWEKWDSGVNNKCHKDNSGYLICEIDRNFEALAIIDTSNLNPITDYNVLGYKCEDKKCKTLGDNIWDKKSTGNKIILEYPETNRANKKYGYGLYFYKPDYIVYGINSYYNGKGTDTKQNPGKIENIIFTKKQGAHAPIEDLSVVNTAYPNMPIMIDLKAGIDAQTYSALSRSGPLISTPEALEDYYKVDTRVTLTIVDYATGLIVHQDSKDIAIESSSSESISFEWTPRANQIGTYTISLSTDVIDARCDQNTKIPELTFKTIQILEGIEDLKDKCYTILNNLETSNQFPTQGDTLTVYANKIANYMDEDGYLSAVESQITLNVYDSSNNIVYTQTLDIDAYTDTYTEEQFLFDIQYQFSQGQYTIQLTGTTENGALCSTKENIVDTISTGVVVEPQNPSNNHAPTINVPDQTLEIGEIITLNINNYMDDQDGDILRLSIVKEPEAEIVSYDLVNNMLTLTGLQQGIASMSLEANDGQAGRVDLFRITVTQEPVDNLPPVITSLPETTTKENELYTYQIKANDPEGDLLQYSLTESPNGMTINPQTGLIQYTPTGSGKHQIRIQVSDGYNTVTQYYKLNVEIKHTKKHLFTLSSELNAINTVAEKGEYFTNNILLRNIGQESEKDIRVKVSIPEIGFSQQVIKELNLGPHDTKWVPLIFKVPNNAKTGTHLFVVETSNKYYSTIKYGTITVTEKPKLSDRYIII